MSNRIFYRDQKGYRLGNVEARINWSDGFSKVWLPESGEAEFNGKGEIKSVTIAGMEYGVHLRVDNDGEIIIKKR